MKKCIILLFFVSLYSHELIRAQSILYSCNDKYHLELPAKLELQSSELNIVKQTDVKGEKTQVNISTRSPHIIFQQKGLNADAKSAFNKYCRVIVEYFKEDRKDPTYGRGDHIVVEKDILSAVIESSKESCVQSGTPFIKLISIQPLSINGFPVLYYSYKRKGWEGKQPPVIVNVYRIFNRYESVSLIFSYREAERENWNDIHDNIMKTFSFVKKY